jgi:DNA-binding IclR family transcriptional regulator
MSLLKQILLAKRILKWVLQEGPMTMAQVCEEIDAPEGQVERMVGLLADYGLLKRFNRSGNTWILLTSSGLHTYRRFFAGITLRAELS